MRRICKLATLCAWLLLVVSLPALADPVNGFSNVQFKGVSGTTVSGPFAFSSSIDKFSNVHVSEYSISEGSFSGGSFLDDSDSDGKLGCGKKDKNCHKVPEGGAEVTYLMLSGIAVCAGILISGKRRRATSAAQSI